MILAAESSSGGGGGAILFLLPLLLLGFLVYITYRQNRARKEQEREAKEVQDSLHPGVEVMTTAGLFGTVVDVDDEKVVLEVSPGVTNTFLKLAIAKVVTDESGDDSEYDAELDSEYDADYEAELDAELESGTDTENASGDAGRRQGR